MGAGEGGEWISSLDFWKKTSESQQSKDFSFYTPDNTAGVGPTDILEMQKGVCKNSEQ